MPADAHRFRFSPRPGFETRVLLGGLLNLPLSLYTYMMCCIGCLWLNVSRIHRIDVFVSRCSFVSASSYL